MAMVVECESCRSRFRLSDSLLKKSKAVRFRCRKCGGSILVRNPHAPPAVPVSAVSAEIAARPAAATDISAVVRPEVEPPAPRETPVPPPPAYDPPNAVPAPPALPVPKAPRLEDLVLLSPGKDVVPRKASTRRKPSPAGRKILVAGLSILLLAGVVLYFGTTKDGQELLGQWFPSWGSPLQAVTPAKPAYDVREVKSTAYEYAVAGNLVVVSGTVVNIGKGTSRGIRMRAVLFGPDNLVLVENSSLAGNLIDEPTLRSMKRNSIEEYLKMEHREEGRPHDIRPGKSLPFMVVFYNLPGKIGNFTAHAADVD